MDTIDEALAQLRTRGYLIGIPYVQAGDGPAGGRMYIPVNNIAMTFPQAIGLARGHLTLDQIRSQNEG